MGHSLRHRSFPNDRCVPEAEVNPGNLNDR